jgi:hypothetical protein
MSSQSKAISNDLNVEPLLNVEPGHQTSKSIQLATNYGPFKKKAFIHNPQFYIVFRSLLMNKI